MENQQTNKKEESKFSTFYGFWKLFGITGGFLVGISMFWYGFNIILTDWIRLRNEMGFLGNIVLAPLVVGFMLVVLSFLEFKNVIIENKDD